MCSAEGRQEIVKRHLVREVGHRKSECHLVALGAKQVVGSEGDVKQIPGFHAVRIMVVVFRSCLGQSQQRRSNRAGACPSGLCKVAGAPLQARPMSTCCAGVSSHRGCRVGNASYHQAAVEAPDESRPIVRPSRADSAGSWSAGTPDRDRCGTHPGPRQCPGRSGHRPQAESNERACARRSCRLGSRGCSPC